MNRLLPRTRLDSLIAIGVIAFAAVAGAWYYQLNGIEPCELCLKQRFAYYAGAPLAGLLALTQSRRGGSLVTAGLIALALIFAANAILGVYHSGVEWGFWPGPVACTGAINGSPNVNDLLKEMATTRVVRCDEVQLRIFTLSLANWSVLISAGLAALAGRATRLPA